MSKLKIIPMLGLEISIDPSELLFHLAQQSSPTDLALVLFRRYGAECLLDALKQGLSGDIATQPVKPVKPVELVESGEPPEMPTFEETKNISQPETIENIPTEPVYIPAGLSRKNCARELCKKPFIVGYKYQKYCCVDCSKLSWYENRQAGVKAKRAEEKRKLQVETESETTNQNANGKTIPNRICAREDCKIEFTPLNRNQIYHDRRCSRILWERANSPQINAYGRNWLKNKQLRQQGESTLESPAQEEERQTSAATN